VAAAKKYTDAQIDSVVEFTTEWVNHQKYAAAMDRIQKKVSTFEDEGLDPKDYVRDTTTGLWKRVMVEEGEVVEDPKETPAA
jgi:hypothetical protein